MLCDTHTSNTQQCFAMEQSSATMPCPKPTPPQVGRLESEIPAMARTFVTLEGWSPCILAVTLKLI